MGAAALVRDPEVAARLRAYINLDAVGADGPVPLFQTGPGQWLAGRTRGRAPRAAPRGGSYQVEVYRRLPSDTDFSVLQRAGIPGLNFAAVGDGYAYHTPRDTPDRLTTRAIADMGTTALSTAEALDRTDLAATLARSRPSTSIVAGARALALRPSFSRALSVLAIVLATIALVRTTRVTAAARRRGRCRAHVRVGRRRACARRRRAAWARRRCCASRVRSTTRGMPTRRDSGCCSCSRSSSWSRSCCESAIGSRARGAPCGTRRRSGW